MGKEAAAFAIDRYSFDGYLASHHKMYCEILARKARKRLLSRISGIKLEAGVRGVTGPELETSERSSG
jgi:hypothetical protein